MARLSATGLPSRQQTQVDDVTRLHFHNGARGENAPVVFGLIGPAQDTDDLTVVLNGDGSTSITGAWELTDTDANAPLTDFVDEIRDAGSGKDVELYFNLHTEEFPAGEIRGQIFAIPQLFFGTTGDDSLDPDVPETPDFFDGVNDLVFTGAGNDFVDISTATGNSRVYGGSDNDQIVVGTNDRAFGGPGNDELNASDGGGDNRLYGYEGNDELIVGTDDRAFGGNGDDILDGSAGGGGNRLYGGNGNDTFSLGNNDRHIGGSGDDLFNVVTGGDNIITGGEGADTFNIADTQLPNFFNTITDFDGEEDIIGINGLGIGFGDLELSTSDGNASIGIPQEDGTFKMAAILLGVDSDNLVADYFSFGQSLV